MFLLFYGAWFSDRLVEYIVDVVSSLCDYPTLKGRNYLTAKVKYDGLPTVSKCEVNSI